MEEYSNIINEHFFIIDSDNLDELDSKFYGYSVIDNEVVHDAVLIDTYKQDGTGAYLFVDVSDEFINIYQDFNGSWGLYLYRENNYFALSNSFFKFIKI